MQEDSLLHRQVHPSFVQGDKISSQVFTSQVFKPTPKDDNLLSVYNGEIFEAEESYEHYTENGKKSVGTVSVSRKECDLNDLPVSLDDDPFEGHCSIDYSGLSNKDISKKAKKLKALASERGWQYQAGN
jgi:hypothetical protein